MDLRRHLVVWREELGSGRILLREVIDLEQTYGGQNQGATDLPVEAAPAEVPAEAPAGEAAAAP